MTRSQIAIAHARAMAGATNARGAHAKIMKIIHERCRRFGDGPKGYCDYVKGANIAGFKKIANAMLAYGAV